MGIKLPNQNISYPLVRLAHAASSSFVHDCPYKKKQGINPARNKPCRKTGIKQQQYELHEHRRLINTYLSYSNMIKGIICDLDGTLVNSIPFFFLHHQELWKTLGIRLTRAFFERYCNGTNPKEFYKTILSHHEGTHRRYSYAMKLHQHMIKQRELRKIRAFPYVKQMLRTLHKSHRIIVASSSPRPYVRTVLKNNGLLTHIDGIVAGNEVKRTKPDPEIFLRARQKLGMKKSDCIIIEDSIHGVMAAKRAGMRVICLLTSNKRKNVSAYATIARTHRQLIPLIERLGKK